MLRKDWHDVELEQFEKLEILHRGRGNKGGRKLPYLDTFATFDIETSTIEWNGQKHAFCYVWMMYFKDFDLMVTGRTMRESIDFLEALKPHLSAYLVVYVHNYAFEFAFQSGVYDFNYDEVFAIKSRKICKSTMMERYEFRCSYFLSNMSLDLYTKKYNVQHTKLSGDKYDYKKLRYPWTRLTKYERDYCTADVVGLAECIKIELDIGHYNIANIPLTSTGFVRADLKSAMRSLSYTTVPFMQPDYQVYKLLRAAFRGGDVHANRYYANRIIENVNSYDRSSSYPDVLCNCKFPMSKFAKVEDCSEEGIKNELLCGHALLMEIEIRNCRLKNPRWPAPYLARHKCEILENADDPESKVKESRKINPYAKAKFDNGRVLCAPLVRTVVTDIDYAIITEQYAGEYYILQAYSSRYGNLFFPYVQCIEMYYAKKTALKGDEAQAPYYEKEKNKLNSCYGVCAENPVKMPQYYYNGLWYEAGAQERDELPDGMPDDLKDKLCVTEEQIYKKYCEKSWSLYQWGVWCTAWARYRLYQGVKMASKARPDMDADTDRDGDFIYCDTDSVKYTGHIDWTAYNAKRKAASEKSGAYAKDIKGNMHYMGVYEHDGEYKRFITLGAKKYATEDEDGELHCTISGVGKKKGAAEIKKRGGLEALVYNPTGALFTFVEAGGSELIYNDEKYYTTLHIDGHELEITRNIVIVDSTYTLGLTPEYDLLISACRTEKNC